MWPCTRESPSSVCRARERQHVKVRMYQELPVYIVGVQSRSTRVYMYHSTAIPAKVWSLLCIPSGENTKTYSESTLVHYVPTIYRYLHCVPICFPPRYWMQVRTIILPHAHLPCYRLGLSTVTLFATLDVGMCGMCGRWARGRWGIRSPVHSGRLVEDNIL